MKRVKKIICVLLALLIFLQAFTGCSSQKTDEEIYITKGEFFAYYVYEHGMSSQKYTPEEIANSENGEVEAEILVEWEYITEDQAKGGLKKPVEKEIVVTVCANATYGLVEGDTAQIKDADLLDNPQLIANAYASGFFELENGYFDGTQKMTFADCEEIMQKANNYTADFHFEANTGEITFDESVHVLDDSNFEEGDFIIDSFIMDESIDNSETESTVMNSIETPLVSTLEKNENSDYGTVDIADSLSLYNPYTNQVKGFMVQIPKYTFEEKLGNPQPGDIVAVTRSNILNSDIKYGKTLSVYGVLKDVILIDAYYHCTFDIPTFEQVAPITEVKKTNASNIDTSSFAKLATEYCGWKLDFNISDSEIKVSASKNFTVNKLGLEKDDKSRKETTKATVDFSIGDLNLDVDNLKSFATKKGTGWLKLTCDTDMEFSLSQSLRYTPYNNRNGKFPSNWNRSRWTDADSKGAKAIKVAKFNVSYYDIVGVEVYVYLKIQVDGTAVFTTSIENGGMKIESNNGNIKFSKLGNKKESFEGTLNVFGRFGIEASLYLLKFINIIKYDVGANADAEFMVGLYYEEKLSEDGVYADVEGLSEYAANDSKFEYCVDATLDLSISGEMKDSGVKMILDYVSKGTSLNFTLPVYSTGIHIEDNSIVDECTRGKDEEVEKSQDDEIELEAYKIILTQYTCQTVKLNALPPETVKVLESKNSITVKSENDDIVSAKYNKKSKTIILEGNDEGSTEITIVGKKGILWWKETVEQKISVTVNKQEDSFSTEVSFVVPIEQNVSVFVA